MRTLPTGTVTFLFTDIEGSTRLWEEHPVAMQVALAQHDTLLREAIEGHRGSVFKTIGDAFCAVFSAAEDALEAATVAQLGLQAALGTGPVALRVRMALHTGEAEHRANDYFGPTLNRVARLLAAGHGGQVLLTLATRDRLPPETSLRSLGEHRLRDITRPEVIFQLQHPGLPESFPPLKTLSTHPNNLPQQATRFIGRKRELAKIKERLQGGPLLTLTGAGGCGKTRLSLQVASEVLEHFPDGVYLVELAPLSDPELVVQAVAEALEVHEVPGEPLARTLRSALSTRELLLVLDNCEHVLDACAQLLTELLRACPKLKVLASSRESLGIAGEGTYRVPSLAPDEARELFTERALAVHPSFSVAPEQEATLEALCQRLDGIPLALELAAARLRAMPLDQLVARLNQRFRLLTGGSRTALPRQQTLRALIDWSYDLLSETAKALLRQLCVFAGGWTLEAAEKVCSGPALEEWEVLDQLTSLVDKSLVVYEESDGHARYRLLETVRQYARERLLETGSAEEVRERHRHYFLARAEQAAPELAGADQVAWLQRLADEHENLRAALEGSLQTSSATEALRFCGALYRFWLTRGYLSEGLDWCTQALGKSGTPDRTIERANTLSGAGLLAHNLGDYPTAERYHQESLTLRREHGDRRGIASSLNSLGIVATNRGELATAQAYYQECLALSRELGDQRSIALALGNLGIVATDQGDAVAARGYYEESLALHRLLGNKRGIAMMLVNQGLCLRDQGNFPGARAYLEESLSLVRELGDRRGIANALNNLGGVALAQGDTAAARSSLKESLILCQQIGDKRGIAYGLEAFARLFLLESDPTKTIEFWGLAEALREQISAPLSPREQQDIAQELAHLRGTLGEKAFEEALSRGRTLTVEQAITQG